jgi:putative CocE/NonD family hydrolase
MKPAALFVLACGTSVLGQAPSASDRAKQLEYTRAHFTKYDYRIPMRDGVRLFTSVYVPKDRSQSYPFLIERTPYSVGPYGIDNYRSVLGQSEAFEKEGFIFVYQDVRGRYLSEGTFIDIPFHKTKFSGPRDTDESTDTYDTIEWLIKNVPNNNGKAGIIGISYPGFYAAFGMINAHPALKAASPQAPMGDVGNGDDAYHNGAFYLAANFGFYTSFKPRGVEPERPAEHVRFDFGTPDEYDFYLRMGPLANSNERYLKNENPYWNDTLQHPNYDEFWSARALAPHMHDITPAALFVGGWFDAEDLSGPLKLFRAVEASGPKAPNTLVMGPWRHGGWARGDGEKLGNLNFYSKTAEFCRDQIELPFFVTHLKGKKAPDAPKAWVFQTGTNQWERYDTWPPKSAAAHKLYLSANGALTFDSGASAASFDEYVSDPARPVPVIGYAGEGMPGDYMTADQRFATARTDVLVYQTPPLDHDVMVTGPISPALDVSTSGADSDFVVKLIDVYPPDFPDPNPNPTGIRMGGFQQLVRGEPFRGKFRKSMSRPEAFTPGKQDQINFTMPDVCHTFRAGHRIMVQIQSSWFPLTDRNPQVFMDIPKAKASDFHKATNRVYHDSYLSVLTQ